MGGGVDEGDLEREVRAWVEANWDPRITVREWWRRLAESGWGYPTWPVEWFGKGLAPEAGAVVSGVFADLRVLGPPYGAGPSMASPVIFHYGTEEQKQRWLPAIVHGTDRWGQFFSEPGAGSDLASVQTRAVRDGDDWLVTGQKVWNSGTLESNCALLVARTNIDVPKHQGITFFRIDLDEQPGIDIRPIKQMNGRAEFNEVFLTDVRVPDANRIGAEGEGWKVTLMVLNHERSSSAGGGIGARGVISVESGERSGVLDRPVGEVTAEQPDVVLSANALPLADHESMIELAREGGKLDDPVVRQEIAAVYSLSEALRLTRARAMAAAAAGRGGLNESSIAYLGGVRLVRAYRDLIARLAGARTLLQDDEGIAYSITTAPCHGIQGGSEQIQRNVIGERLLGLPREAQVDRDTPFKDLKVGTQR